MSKSVTPEEALADEFACYYGADTLPTLKDRTLDDVIPELASDSADRLRDRVGQERVPQLVALLLELRGQPSHPFVKRLENESVIDWAGADTAWRQFQAIITGIVSGLNRV